MALVILWVSLTAALVFEVFGEIKIPTHIRIQAFNLKYVLKWDNVKNSNYSVNYTVNYRSKVGAWKKVKGCKRIAHTECDFTSADIIFNGEYILRLRAHQGNQTSAWLCTDSFIPSRNNEIGPPSVQAESKGHLLTVSISELYMENNASIEKMYKDISYRITYWKENSHEIRNEKNSTNRLVVLKLDPWATYCLNVLAFSSMYNKTGQASLVVCEKTGGATPEWQIAIGFFVSLVMFFIVPVGCTLCIHCTYRCIMYTLFPPHTLPEHIQECFSEPSQSAPLHVLTSVEDSEECCDPLIVVTKTKSVSSCSSSFISTVENEMHDQSGQTSADSGQFSNAGSSRIEEFGERTLTDLDLQT
ncbi:interferon alpha/beta receptor 1a-like [Amblyraja radiata]|uniref:interferon alpha/beta receptor 1a-like n=1 Tax=Amblyraja radiata TaxID=386614 RepID=UPI0014027CE1|nr:interferon alpha/beta receptor 1a-like [Amblyraja radiata]